MSAAREDDVVALPPDVTMPSGQETRVVAGAPVCHIVEARLAARRAVQGVSAVSELPDCAESQTARFLT